MRKLEGGKAAIGLQANSMASPVIDDPLRVGECFFEKNVRFTKTELQQIVYQLTDGQLRSRLEAALSAGGWEISASAVRFAINDGSHVCGVRLVKGESRAFAVNPTTNQIRRREIALVRFFSSELAT